MKEKIESFLIKNNFNPSLKGFPYIVSCIEYMLENNIVPSEISVCKELYVEVAKKHNTNSAAVDRCIRGCVYEAHYKDVQGLTPSNSKFLGILYYFVKNEVL